MTSGGATTSLTWDGKSRLKTAPVGGSTTTYSYNGIGQRISKTGATTNSYTLADDGIDSKVLSDGNASYSHGANGLVSESRGGTSKFYHADALGSVRALTNASGSVTDTKSTDAFGMVVSSSGSTPTPFGFAGNYGYQQDSETGLMRLGHRMYDASTGRFLSRDPIQDGYNWYAYCDNDPVNAVDPEGQVPLLLALAIVALVVFVDQKPVNLPEVYHPIKDEDKETTIREHTKPGSIATQIVDAVKNYQQGGDWDRKKDFPKGDEYGDDWGNWDFGYDMANIGTSEYIAKNIGGLAQILKGDGGTGSGIPFLIPPFGDQWDDYLEIGDGYNRR